MYVRTTTTRRAAKEAANQLVGNNTYILPDKLPEKCSNNTNAPTLDRCYVYAGRYIDVYSPSADAQHTGSPMPNGYTVRVETGSRRGYT